MECKDNFVQDLKHKICLPPEADWLFILCRGGLSSAVNLGATLAVA
jgi:hypothetical protein